MLSHGYTLHAEIVKKERKIKDEWVYRALHYPDIEDIKEDGTIHYIKLIEEFENRYLHIVVNKESLEIVTLFFDRRFRKKL